MRNSNNEIPNNRKRAGDDIYRDDMKVKKQTVRKSKTVKGANTEMNGNQGENMGSRNNGYQDMRGEEMDIEHVRDGDATLYRVGNNGNYEIITDTWNSTKKPKKQSVPKIPKIPKVKKGKEQISNLTSTSSSTSSSSSNISAVGVGGGVGNSNEINAMDALFWALEQQEKMKINQLEKEKRENEKNASQKQNENENALEIERKKTKKSDSNGQINCDEKEGMNDVLENVGNKNKSGERETIGSGSKNGDVKRGDNDETTQSQSSSSSSTSSIVETI